MTLHLLNWLITFALALGFVGLAALFLGANALFWVVLSAIKSFVGTRWGLAITVGAACLYGGLAYGDHEGRSEATAVCQAAQARAEQEAKARDADQGALAGDDEKQRLADLETQHNADQVELEKYRHVEAAHNDTCHALTPDDLK